MLAFVHIPKTAGTTLQNIMVQSFGATYCRVRLWPTDGRLNREQVYRIMTSRDLYRTRLVYWRLRAIGGHRVVPHGDLHEHSAIRYFAFFRNPISRSASHFQFLKRNGSEDVLEDWIRKPFYHNMQCVKIAGEPNADKAIEVIRDRVRFVGLQESFDESLVLLSQWAEPYKLDIRYHSRNVLKDEHAKKKDKLILDESSREMLSSINKEDIRLYDFVKEMYDRQVEKYQGDLENEVSALRETNESFRQKGLQSLSHRIIRKALYFPLLRFISRGEVVHDFSDNN